MVHERPTAAFGGSPPHEGETRAKRARGSLTHHLELQLSNIALTPGATICRRSAAQQGHRQSQIPDSSSHVITGCSQRTARTSKRTHQTATPRLPDKVILWPLGYDEP